ncbi:MAG TPA: DNA-directed RNA polymerase subunit B [Candidatus Norongarragalinales archaeon]|jgi:DNA-directed RNA polymerase subunit B'|nr:DNA-directed RNA polymerase subunit B [Candidatus Norongarragalinales archaeon]
MADKSSIFLNGRFFGFHEDGGKLAAEIREKRRSGDIEPETNVAFYKRTNEVFINNDEGRVRRPLIVVKKGKSMLNAQHIEKLKSGEIHWNDLIKQGVIEMIDSEEEENAYVALEENDLTDKHTHLEIEPTIILGYASSQMPFPEYNASPRVLMASQHTKQALGLYSSNFNQRLETRSHLLHYPQQPLVQTRVYRASHNYLRPSGQNFVVAVLSFHGYNMQDAVVLNKDSIERGLGRSTFYRTYTAEERRYPGGQKDKFQIPEEFVQGYLGEEAYANLAPDGIIAPESVVKGDSVLVGKTSPPRFLKEISALEVDVEKRRESSVTVRSNEDGVVDNVILSETTAGNRYVKVRVRKSMIPEIGDKFSSRYGQKGVVSLMVPQEDMPFTRNGITPDLIINPHAIPGRMTAGHLLEMLAGKTAALDGLLKDGTAFTGQDQEDFESALAAQGFVPQGEEIMYDGKTGRALHAKIFVGVIFYQRLHHLVSLKMHARSRGPVQMLTHQPTEGRAREGGLRLGEMERDCFIGFGAASLLKERMIDSSDKTTELVCADCGSLAVLDKIKNKGYCPVDASTNVHPVEMSYAFKLLVDEMKSIGIFPKLRLKEKG